MPSLPTKKGNFLYYYDRDIDILQGRELNESFCDSFSLFIKVTLFICLIVWIPLILVAILQYLFYNNNNWYESHHFEYLSTMIFFIICSIGNSIFMLSLMKQYHHSKYAKVYGNLIHSMITNKIPYSKSFTIIILSIILPSIGAILLLIFKSKLESIIIINTDVNVCKSYLHCSPYSLYRFLKEAIFPGLYLPLIYFIMYSLHIREVFEGITDEDELDTDLQMILLIENNRKTRKNVQDSAETAESSFAISEIHDDGQSNTKHIRWCILFIILLCFIMVWFNIEYALNLNFYVSYWQFIALITINKFILKRVGRKVDRMKSINDDYNHYISIEYSMEWFFSCIYWNWMLTFCIFNDLSAYNFVMIIGFHFVLEIIETNIKFTQLYFDTTAKWTQSWDHRDDEYCCFSLRKLYDDSNIKEWRIRLSMDIMARFYCSFIITVLKLIHCGLLGRKGVMQYYDSKVGDTAQQYNHALMYVGIAGILELLHYLLTFAVTNKMHGFNILTVFLNYVISMKRLQIIFSMCLLVYFVWVF